MVTGGFRYQDGGRVQVYTLSGPQEQLPDLQTPRSGHACAHYMDNQNRVVSIIACNITAYLSNCQHFAMINDNYNN